MHTSTQREREKKRGREGERGRVRMNDSMREDSVWEWMKDASESEIKIINEDLMQVLKIFTCLRLRIASLQTRIFKTYQAFWDLTSSTLSSRQKLFIGILINFVTTLKYLWVFYKFGQYQSINEYTAIKVKLSFWYKIKKKTRPFQNWFQGCCKE